MMGTNPIDDIIISHYMGMYKLKTYLSQHFREILIYTFADFFYHRPI